MRDVRRGLIWVMGAGVTGALVSDRWGSLAATAVTVALLACVAVAFVTLLRMELRPAARPAEARVAPMAGSDLEGRPLQLSDRASLGAPRPGSDRRPPARAA